MAGGLHENDPLVVNPPGAVDDNALGTAFRFCSLASLRYDASDEPPRWQAAAELIEVNPSLPPQENVWAAASAADPAALTRHLQDRPELVTTAGGPFGWVPLLYLCYSRVPLPHRETDVLAAASALLDAGAIPTPAICGAHCRHHSRCSPEFFSAKASRARVVNPPAIGSRASWHACCCSAARTPPSTNRPSTTGCSEPTIRTSSCCSTTAWPTPVRVHGSVAWASDGDTRADVAAPNRLGR